MLLVIIVPCMVKKMHVHIIRDYVPWVSSLGHAHDYDSATNNNTPKTHDSDALTSAS